MSNLSRAVATIATVGAAALTLGAGPAQAEPNRVHLITSTNAVCTQIGTTGVANGVFVSYECKSGVGGYSTLVDPTITSLTDVPVWTSTLTNCNTVGNNGKTNGAWSSYLCQLGIAGYTLLVSR